MSKKTKIDENNNSKRSIDITQYNVISIYYGLLNKFVENINFVNLFNEYFTRLNNIIINSDFDNTKKSLLNSMKCIIVNIYDEYNKIFKKYESVLLYKYESDILDTLLNISVRIGEHNITFDNKNYILIFISELINENYFVNDYKYIDFSKLTKIQQIEFKYDMRCFLEKVFTYLIRYNMYYNELNESLNL